MRPLPLPKEFAAAFEDWCKECNCQPGDKSFQLSLAVSFENFLRLYLESVARAQSQLADAFLGISLTDTQAAPKLIVSGAGAQSREERLQSVGCQFAEVVFRDIGSSSFRPSGKARP